MVLKFKETMLLCGLLREIGVKEIVKGLTSSEFDAKLAKLKTPKEKQTMIAIEVITAIVENVDKGAEKLESLLSSYLNKDVALLDADDIVEGLKNIVMNGLPKIVTDMIDVEDIKKKIKSKK